MARGNGGGRQVRSGNDKSLKNQWEGTQALTSLCTLAYTTFSLLEEDFF